MWKILPLICRQTRKTKVKQHGSPRSLAKSLQAFRMKWHLLGRMCPFTFQKYLRILLGDLLLLVMTQWQSDNTLQQSFCSESLSYLQALWLRLWITNKIKWITVKQSLVQMCYKPPDIAHWRTLKDPGPCTPVNTKLFYSPKVRNVGNSQIGGKFPQKKR